MRLFALACPSLLGTVLLAAAPAAAQQLPLDRQLRVAQGQKLQLDLDAGAAVRVTGTDGTTLRVRVEEGSRPCRPECRVEVEQTGGGVRVHTYHADEARSRSSSLRVDVEVPRRFDLEVETAGGAVAIDGVTGEIEGKTMGGALTFSRLGGRLDFSTMGGAVSVRDSEVDGRVHTMGGAVTLDNVQGNLNASTMGGRVTRRGGSAAPARAAATGRQGGGAVRMRTMGGDISIAEAPQGADLHTMGGDIRVASARDHVRATTMGGRIQLEQVDGRIYARTMGGDVTARMVGDPARGDRSVEISSMGGDIELVVPADLSMDVDIELAYTRGNEGEYRITSDFPLHQETSERDTRHGRARRTIRATGSIAGGKHPVRIRTIDGNVRLVRAR